MQVGLLDLIAPRFLAGFEFPDSVEQILTFLRVREMETAWDDQAVIYTGKAMFNGQGAASPVPVYNAPSGAVMEWEDVNIGFRLTIPREAGVFIRDAMDQAADLAPTGSPVDDLEETLNALDIIVPTGGDPQPSDYPGVAFRLELILTAITIHLPKNVFMPAKVAADGWLEPDTTKPAVKIILPKVAMELTQGDTYGDLDVNFIGWGINTLDDPADPAAGELIRMDPPLALHSSGVFGFGLEKIVMDLTDDFTPPEILEQFGVGDEFTGLWIPHVRLFFSTSNLRGFAFDLRANDLLIDFNEGVSGEFALSVIQREGELNVEPRFFEGDSVRTVTRGNKKTATNSITYQGSRATVASDGELQLTISGGLPVYTVEVKLDGVVIPATDYNGDPNRKKWVLPGGAERDAVLVYIVTDSSGAQQTFQETINLHLNAAGTVTGSTEEIPPPTFAQGPCDAGFKVEMTNSQPDNNAISLKVTPATVSSVTANGTPVTVPASGEFSILATPGGGPITVVANWPATTYLPFVARYEFDKPKTTNDRTIFKNRFVADPKLTTFMRAASGKTVTVEGNASYEGYANKEPYNTALSQRRLDVLKEAMAQIVTNSSGSIVSPTITDDNNGTKRPRTPSSAPPDASEPGFNNDPNLSSDPYLGTFGSHGEPNYQSGAGYWSAVARITVPSTPSSCTITVERPGPIIHPVITPTERGPQPEQPPRPPIFKSITLRIRMQRNLLVLAEVKGQLDFQTQAEDAVDRIQSADNRTEPEPSVPPAPPPPPSNITVNSNPGASDPANINTGATGILDYRLTVTYDSAIRELTQVLALGFDTENRNGWLVIPGFNPAPLSNTLGSLAVFAPLIAGSINSAVNADGDEKYVDIAVAAISIGTAVTLGLTGAFKMTKFIFYGGEITASQTLPDYMVFDGASFDSLGFLFDYAVEFEVDIKLGPIKIKSTPGVPIRVRYRAIGFKLNFNTDPTYQPIFDTSKGFEFDLADPGLFDLGSPFGEIIKVLGARVARTNPFMMEFNLGLKVNLGIISIDSFKVRIPIDPPGVPSIIPTGASVNIPGTLKGSGYVDLRDGFTGQLDITLIPVKLRIAAGLAVKPLEVPGRNVTGIYLSLIVEFPAAIPLGGTGLGIFGILGLFAMHFKRLENPAASVPALDWLNTIAQGDPTKITAWGPEVDRYAFGVGVVLGSMEGGTIFNLKGMLVLELPGPRILIFVNAKIITPKPETEGQADTGILAIVDLDFVLKKLTIGLIISYEIEKVISLKIPVEAMFSFTDITNWHLYIGTIQNPASADVLGLVKAQGYMMFDGKEITGFPMPSGPINLPGFAIALGIRAAIILGSKPARLYLSVSASLDVGLSFSPFHMYGVLDLRGELVLFIISISAWATLTAEAPDPTYLEGKACGKIDLFFFSIKGCVKIRIGDPPPLPPPPDLIRALSLQSRSPALIEGQGTDRPIDASLGKAKEVNSINPGIPEEERLIVPIDSVPVFNMHAAPKKAGGFTTFTDAIPQAPRLKPGGWVPQSENILVRYEITKLEISPPLSESPPATWWAPTNSAEGSDTSVDLATFSWTPDPSPRAIQRSQELTDRLINRWEGLCDEVAPATCILWTFRFQNLGPNPAGWHLQGEMWPDPPDTVRSGYPDMHLWVHEESEEEQSSLTRELFAEASGRILEPAKVIGAQPGRVVVNDSLCGRVLQLPFEHVGQSNSDINLPGEYLEIAPKQPQKIIVESRCFKSGQFLVAMPDGLNPKDVTFRALNGQNNLIAEFGMDALIVKAGASFADLPANWKDPNGPWVDDVNCVMNYLNARQKNMIKYLLQWAPPEETMRFEIMVPVQIRIPAPPAFLLCIMEMCPCSEEEREAHDTEAQSSSIQMLEAGLQGGALRPLLKPDTQYTLSLSYNAEVKQIDSDGAEFVNSSAHVQRFSFFTDNAAPERLDPWIMTTTPYNGSPYHFVKDEVRLFLSDASAIQLFSEYGKSLKVVVRKANGDHPASQPTLDGASLAEMDGVVLTPWESTIRDEVYKGDCLDEVEVESHRVFTLAIPLERKTSYTLDVEVDPANPIPADANATAKLFRIAFMTSRFLSADELATMMSIGNMTDRILRSPLALLPETPSDIQIEEALLNAGLEALPPATDPEITLLWESVGGSFNLRALLIDSPEPLWRSRREPMEEVVPNDGADMIHWVMDEVEYLALAEDGTNAVQRFVRSPGGTRTLVMLKPGAGSLKLVLRQQEVGIVPGGSATDHTIMDAALPTDPTWVMNRIED